MKLTTPGVMIAAALALSACGSGSTEAPLAVTEQPVVAPIATLAPAEDPAGTQATWWGLDGTTAVFGDPLHVHYDAFAGINGYAGIYVFEQQGTAWPFTQELIPAGTGDTTWRTASGALAGDTILAGAPNRAGGSTLPNCSGASCGEVFVFNRSGTTWTQATSMVPSYQCGNGQRFGTAVALRGSTALIGAPYADSANFTGACLTATPHSGAAHVFVRTGTTWAQQARLLPGDITTDVFFGNAVALAEDGATAVVGAPYDDAVATNAGAAYVFARSGTTWAQQVKLTVAGAAAATNFGYSVAVSGTTVIVGGPGFKQGLVTTGAAFVYRRSGTTWAEEARWQPATAASQFARGVEVSGDTALVTGDPTTGMTRVYRRSGTAWSFVDLLATSTAGAPRISGARAIHRRQVYSIDFGTGCAVGADCASGSCRGGVCCDVSCDGACQTCALAEGAASEGTCATLPSGAVPLGSAGCGPYLCDGASADCATACTDHRVCVGDQFCDSAWGSATRFTCQPDQALGADCGSTGLEACQSGFCASGVCCDQACTDSGSACIATLTGVADGTCAPRDNGGQPCSTGATCGTTFCADSVCCDALCDGPGVACVVAATGVATGTCAPVILGAACTAGADCASGACADGVCCDRACDAAGESCLASLTGLAAGVCGPVALGLPCALGADCASGFCSDGVCCSAACSATGDSCLTALTGLATGTCGPVMNGLACSSGTTCGSGFCADGVCCNEACDQPSDACIQSRTGVTTGLCGPILNGNPCSNNNQCGSGFCAEGVCCDTACADTCESCLASRNGSTTGECLPIPLGQDPQNECDPQGSGVCRLPGHCSGTRACLNYQDTVCGTPVCSSTTGLIPAARCDGAGECISPSSTDCAPYTCDAGACRTSCTADVDCAGTNRCVAGECRAVSDDGAVCDAGADCASGHCVDRVCCESECTGTCMSCTGNRTGDVDGSCRAILDGEAPTLTGGCPSSGDLCGADGTCDGQGACRTAAVSGKACGTVCEQGSELTRACDGFGACLTTSTRACTPYSCVPGGSTCRSTCTADAECATGAQCNLGTGQCAAAGSSCRDAVTAVSPGGQETDCTPYTCAAGVCRDACSTTSDCAAGFGCQGAVCTASGDGGIQPPTETGVDVEKGCGCRAAGTAPRAGWPALVLLGVAAGQCRRRRAPGRRHVTRP